MEDRALEDPAQAIGRIDAKLADLESTLLARLVRRPVGDVEPTIRATPKQNTLILNGALVDRTTYAALWAWAQSAGLVVTGLFTTGNGTTTFGLPDMRGRVPIGVGTLGSDTYALGQTLGASARVITTANMPAHDHNVSGSTGSDSHSHSGSTGGGGSHGGHQNNSETTPGGQYGGLAVNMYFNGDHSHGLNINSDTHSHSLSINESTVGSGTAFDVRQPSIAINWLIWV